jgi:hypothetical protein
MEGYKASFKMKAPLVPQGAGRDNGLQITCDVEYTPRIGTEIAGMTNVGPLSIAFDGDEYVVRDLTSWTKHHSRFTRVYGVQSEASTNMLNSVPPTRASRRFTSHEPLILEVPWASERRYFTVRTEVDHPLGTENGSEGQRREAGERHACGFASTYSALQQALIEKRDRVSRILTTAANDGPASIALTRTLVDPLGECALEDIITHSTRSPEAIWEVIKSYSVRDDAARRLVRPLLGDEVNL